MKSPIWPRKAPSGHDKPQSWCGGGQWPSFKTFTGTIKQANQYTVQPLLARRGGVQKSDVLGFLMLVSNVGRSNEVKNVCRLGIAGLAPQSS